jgi:hypothetical protein
MAKDAGAVTAKWLRGTTNAGESYKAGIQAVTEAPTQAAARRLDLYRQRTAEAVDSGRMAAALQSVSLESWKSAAINTGAGRLASGAQKGQARYASFAQKFAPVWSQISQQVQSMPKGTREAAAARVMAAADAMKAAAGKSW